MNKNNSKYCPVAWNSVSILPDGRLRLCCHASEEHLIDDLKISEIQSLAEVSNSDSIQKTRDSFLNRQPIAACEGCTRAEKAGIRSARNELNEFFNTDSYEQGDQQVVEYLDISFSNECNMQCPMCSANYSSLWARENKETNSKKIAISKELISSKVFSELTKNLKLVLIQGGEPLLSSSHKPFLEHLINQGRSKEICLDYVTNFSLPIKEDLIELWKKFKKINLFISIEGVGKTYDLTRPPQKWEKQEKVLEQIKKLKTINDLAIDFNAKAVIQCLNLDNLKEIIEYFKNYEAYMPYIPEFSLLGYPTYLKTNVINSEKKSIVLDDLEYYISTLEFKSFKEKNQKNMETFKSLISIMKNEEYTPAQDKLLFQTKYFQKKYKLDYSETLKKIY